jgi:hypothetical protein
MKELTYNSTIILKKMIAQNSLHKSIQREFQLFVWYSPRDAKFVYDDMFFELEDIEPLIANNLIIFKSFATHQGVTMVKYILNKTI